MHSICTVEFDIELGLATKWLRILSLGGIDKIRNHLVANPIVSEFSSWDILRVIQSSSSRFQISVLVVVKFW